MDYSSWPHEAKFAMAFPAYTIVLACHWFDLVNNMWKQWATLLVGYYFFFFRLFPSGVATADFPSPVVSINCILLRHFNLSHVLFRHISKPPFWPSTFPLSWQLHPQHPSPNIPIIFHLTRVPHIDWALVLSRMPLLTRSHTSRFTMLHNTCLVLSCDMHWPTAMLRQIQRDYNPVVLL